MKTFDLTVAILSLVLSLSALVYCSYVYGRSSMLNELRPDVDMCLKHLREHHQ